MGSNRSYAVSSFDKREVTTQSNKRVREWIMSRARLFDTHWRGVHVAGSFS